MQSTLKRELKVPEIVLGEAFEGVTMRAVFHRAILRAAVCGGAYGHPVGCRCRGEARALRQCALGLGCDLGKRVCSKVPGFQGCLWV